jgi:hypothetical protein
MNIVKTLASKRYRSNKKSLIGTKILKVKLNAIDETNQMTLIIALLKNLLINKMM